jgi:hypothetical protein
VGDLIQKSLYTKRGRKRIKRQLDMNEEKHAKSRPGRKVSGEKETILPTKHATRGRCRTASAGNESQTPNRSVSTGTVMKPRKEKRKADVET